MVGLITMAVGSTVCLASTGTDEIKDACAPDFIRGALVKEKGRVPSRRELVKEVRECEQHRAYDKAQDVCGRTFVEAQLAEKLHREPSMEEVRNGMRECEQLSKFNEELDVADDVGSASKKDQDPLERVEKMGSEDSKFLDKRNQEWDECPLIPLPSPKR